MNVRKERKGRKWRKREKERNHCIGEEGGNKREMEEDRSEKR